MVESDTQRCYNNMLWNVPCTHVCKMQLGVQQREGGLSPVENKDQETEVRYPDWALKDKLAFSRENIPGRGKRMNMEQ